MNIWLFILIIFLVILYSWYSIKQKEKYIDIDTKAKILKERLFHSGTFIESPYSSPKDFLTYIGIFLKHKKHEWIFIAFAKNHEVYKCWIEKGSNGQFVDINLDFYEIADICQDGGYDHLLVGHNHPAGIFSPSKQDRILLKEFIDFFDYFDIGVTHYLFVAGKWKSYGLSFSQKIIHFFEKK